MQLTIQIHQVLHAEAEGKQFDKALLLNLNQEAREPPQCETLMNDLVHKVHAFKYHSGGNFEKGCLRSLALLVSESFSLSGIKLFKTNVA